MKRVETITRISLIVAAPIYLVSAILLLKCTFLIRGMLEDSKVYPYGLSVTVYSGSLVIGSLLALAQSASAYTPRTSARIILFLSMSTIFGYMVFAQSRSNLDFAQNRLKIKLTILQLQYDWGLTGFSNDAPREATEIWDTLQSDYECCGVHSPEDWSPFAPKRDSNALPISCCVNQEPVESSVKPSGTKYDDNRTCNSTSTRVYEEGCAVLMKEAISSSTAVFTVVIWVKFLLLVLYIIIWLLNLAREDLLGAKGNRLKSIKMIISRK